MFAAVTLEMGKSSHDCPSMSPSHLLGNAVRVQLGHPRCACDRPWRHPVDPDAVVTPLERQIPGQGIDRRLRDSDTSLVMVAGRPRCTTGGTKRGNEDSRPPFMCYDGTTSVHLVVE